LYCTHRVLQKGQSISQRLVFADDYHPPDPVGVTSEVFGSRMHDDVSSVLERALQYWRAESIVRNHYQALSMGELAHLGDVDQLEHRIGWRFDPNQLRLRSDCRLKGGKVVQVDPAEVKVRGAPTDPS